MIRAVIFDLDGLLIDSEPLWDRSDKFFLKRKGLNYTPELRMKVMGTGQKETTEIFKRELGLKGQVDELIKERKEIFYSLFFKRVQLMNGALQFIKKINNGNLLMAIATGGYSVEEVKEILRLFNLYSFFPTLVSSDQVKNGKPSPEIYLFTAKKLGVEPSKCLILEDSVNGVLSGKRAGMKVFGVNKDVATKKQLKEAGADKVFSSLFEIKEL